MQHILELLKVLVLLYGAAVSKLQLTEMPPRRQQQRNFSGAGKKQVEREVTLILISPSDGHCFSNGLPHLSSRLLIANIPPPKNYQNAGMLTPAKETKPRHNMTVESRGLEDDEINQERPNFPPTSPTSLTTVKILTKLKRDTTCKNNVCMIMYMLSTLILFLLLQSGLRSQHGRRSSFCLYIMLSSSQKSPSLTFSSNPPVFSRLCRTCLI